MLSRAERLLLLIPVAGGAVFGALAYLAEPSIVATLGYTASDQYVYRLAGAASLGYVVALAVTIRDGSWAAARWVVAATLAFNVVSLGACAIEIWRGRAQPVVYVILAASVVIVAITVVLLVRYRAPEVRADAARWIVWATGIGIASAAIFGVLALLPEVSAAPAGYTGVDVFVWRQAGAATLGYAVMGVGELSTRRWAEMRSPAIMGTVFNGLAFVASAIELLGRGPTVVDALVAPASLVFCVLFATAVARRGR
jgi:hypothetical protein